MNRPMHVAALLLVAVLVLSTGLVAQEVTKVGTTSAKFLSIPVGAVIVTARRT